MRGAFLIILAAVAALIAACGPGDPDPARLVRLEPEKLDALAAHLRDHGRPPVEFVLDRLRTHNVVFLGEMHRIRHDVLLVDKLLPRLAEAGVHDLGSEFFCAEDQRALDDLLTAPRFDEAAARELLRHGTGGTWAYREYLELLRTAWRCNRGRAAGTPPLRIIGLIPRLDYALLHEGTAEERERERRRSADYDRIMAEALEREVLSRGRKVLVHCGINHAFTRYRKMVLEDGQYREAPRVRCGHYLYEKYADAVSTVFLHAPWYSYDGDDVTWYLPFNGAIDQAFAAHGGPVGFEIVGSPFADLTHPGASYAEGFTPTFRAEHFADAWIVTKPIDEYEGVSVISEWVESDAVFAQLKRQLPNRRWAETLASPEEYLTGVGRDAELPRIYGECIAAWRRFRGAAGSVD